MSKQPEHQVRPWLATPTPGWAFLSLVSSCGGWSWEALEPDLTPPQATAQWGYQPGMRWGTGGAEKGALGWLEAAFQQCVFFVDL